METNHQNNTTTKNIVYHTSNNNLTENEDCVCQENINETKVKLISYTNEDKLIHVCKTFECKEVQLFASFMGKSIQICNCNAVGDILEDIFYEKIKKEIDDFEEGPKQSSPDYFGMNKYFEFEQKVFMINPGFDISNFTSYVNQLCEPDGVFRKLFRTKYLIFEYFINEKNIIIKQFHYLNVYNLVSYNGKYPISMQVKKNIWYNIRPDNVKNWYMKEKNPMLFIDKIIECIKLCHHIDDKENKINNITNQFNYILSKYTL